jgi:hypothetical protein
MYHSIMRAAHTLFARVYGCLHVNDIVFTQHGGTYQCIMRA